MPELRTETMTVNMGPQHPSTHGVLRLVLELDGETIRSASPTIGFLHTGIEKTAEQKKWQQVIPLVERMDYLASITYRNPVPASNRSALQPTAAMPHHAMRPRRGIRSRRRHAKAHRAPTANSHARVQLAK